MGSSPFQFTGPNENIDLTTVDLVHQYAGIKTSAVDDPLIQLCITAASYQWIWRTGRGEEGQIVSESPFVSPVQYSESYDGNGSFILYVRNWPIISVVSLTVNGQAKSPSTGYGSGGYAIHQNSKAIILRSPSYQNRLGRAPRGLGFDEGIQNVQLVTSAGFNQVPPQVVEKCTEMVALNYKRKGWLDMASKSEGAAGVTGTTSYRSWELTPGIRQVMEDFSRLPVS